ncbi:hypothetical protein LCGC14_0570280 [marine sediment metagenome]|uniref:Uncharacterized protein n=1 Tax=marine sediment metagenome TaxID=412755 RepID=A0A0F9U5N3_9ZZZZ|nr:hypothetical protein [Pricia sp.]
MNVNRYVDHEAIPIIVGVASGVTVEQGDMMFLDKDDNLRNDGSSTADNYAYPFEYHRISGSSLTLNKASVKDYFLGVSLDDVDGVNNTIIQKVSIGTTGKYNLDMKPAKTIRTGQMFGASGTTTASDLLNQKVMKVTDTSLALGYFAEAKVHALTADVIITSIIGEPNKI